MENAKIIKPAEQAIEPAEQAAETATKKRAFAEPRFAVEQIQASRFISNEKAAKLFRLKLELIHEETETKEETLIEALKMTTATYLLVDRGNKNYMVNVFLKIWTDVLNGELTRKNIVRIVNDILDRNFVIQDGRGNKFSAYCWKEKELVIRQYYMAEAMNGNVFRRIGKPVVIGLENLIQPKGGESA